MVDVAIVMGSYSDYECMVKAKETLENLGVTCDIAIISAHRMPEELLLFSQNAQKKGYKVIIAGAGGAAHLPGMMAASTNLPVIGVPIKTRTLNGVDSLLSIVQMPSGVPVATMSIGDAGAINAAIFATRICAINNVKYSEKLQEFHAKMHSEAVKSNEKLD